MRRRERAFFARASTAVAPDLLGDILVRRVADGTALRARIVETEAYDRDDPASHTFRGMTARNAVMFGPAGHLYVYFTYGMHHCMNVVTERVGHGSAVLLRAAEPIEGLEAMGRARLAQAFGIDRSFDGVDLVRGSQVWIERGPPIEPADVRTGPRIGIRVGVDRPWRFWLDEPWVSASRSPASARR